MYILFIVSTYMFNESTIWLMISTWTRPTGGQRGGTAATGLEPASAGALGLNGAEMIPTSDSHFCWQFKHVFLTVKPGFNHIFLNGFTLIYG